MAEGVGFSKPGAGLVLTVVDSVGPTLMLLEAGTSGKFILRGSGSGVAGRCSVEVSIVLPTDLSSGFSVSRSTKVN